MDEGEGLRKPLEITPLQRLRDVIQREHELRREHVAAEQRLREYLEENVGKHFFVSAVSHSTDNRVTGGGRERWVEVTDSSVRSDRPNEPFARQEMVLDGFEMDEVNRGVVRFCLPGDDSRAFLVSPGNIHVLEPIELEQPVEAI